MTGISSLKSFLHDQFHTKDLGKLKYFLRVEVMRSKHEIFLSQTEYMLYLLSETGKLGGSHVAYLWHKAYILLKKTNCLGTLRDLEDRLVS